MKQVTAELGLQIPDYVGNAEVYKALNSAAETLEMSHITAFDMSIVGLDFEQADCELGVALAEGEEA